jgi:cobalt-zinc-cadmium efflux system protein
MTTQHPSMASAHRHAATRADLAGRLRLVLVLVLIGMVLEAVVGLATGSLALVADAGHMVTDAAAIVLALLAIRFAARPATPAKSFGYHRFEVLAALANGVLLLGIAAVVAWEAIGRLTDPPTVDPGPVLAVAAIGLAINLVAVRTLHAHADGGLNARAVTLEVTGDLLGSVAVLVGAAIILVTGIQLADVIASLFIAAFIAVRAAVLLREVTDVLLQATPAGVDLDLVRRHVLDTEGVADAHDLHAWTLTSGMHVVSAHVVLHQGADPSAVLDRLCQCLSDDFDFEHSTIQLETADRRRLEDAPHA